MAYDLEGACVEACSCGDVCPCSAGQDPDGGRCEGMTAYHVTRGKINGVDVSGLSVVEVAESTGNIQGGGRSRYLIYLDERANDDQQRALLEAFTGKLGGPLADVARLWGADGAQPERVSKARIAFEHKEGHEAKVKVGERLLQAESKPFRGAGGKVTTLEEPVASPIPGAPLHLGRAPTYKVEDPGNGMSFEFHDHSAREGHFRFQA